MKNNPKDRLILDEQYFTNTEILLKNYRNIQMSINCREIDYEESFLYFGIKEDDLEPSFNSNDGSEISKQQIIDMNNKLINYMAICLEEMRKSNSRNEKYYEVLYYRYLSMEEYSIDIITKRFLKISKVTFFKKLKKAIEELAVIMWGVPGINNKEFTGLCEMFARYLPKLETKRNCDELIKSLLNGIELNNKSSVKRLTEIKELVEEKLEQAYLIKIKKGTKKTEDENEKTS